MSDELALLGGTPTVTECPPFRWPPIEDGDVAAVVDLLRRRELSYYGREGKVEELEDKFREYLPARYALAVSSGTAALHSAFFGIGIERGDEVLAPTYTFLATVMPILVVNGVPVLVDADPETGNLDPADLDRHITRRTKAIVVTHMWGNPVDMGGVLEVARRHGLRVVEDCSHAHGATWDGQKVGTFGDVAAFSLQGKKLVAAGQGGMLVTDDPEIYERATLLGHFKVRAYQEVKSARHRQFASTGYGLNYRMHALAAALASSQFDRLEAYVEGRRANLEHLSRALADVPGIEPPVLRPHVTRHVYYSYKPLYRPDELGGLPIDAYIEALGQEGLPIEKSETLPLHLEPIFAQEGADIRSHGRPERLYTRGDLPQSEAYAARALALPPYTEPARDTMDAFAEAFAKVARHADSLHEHWGRKQATAPAVAS